MKGRDVLSWSLLVFALTSFAVASIRDGEDEETFIVIRASPNTTKQLDFVRILHDDMEKYDLDFWLSPHAVGHFADIMLRESRKEWLMEKLENQGIPFFVSIPDVQKLILDREHNKPNRTLSNLLTKFSKRFHDENGNKARYGFGDYHSYDVIMKWMDDIERHYPDRAKVITIGHTAENRPIKTIKIGKNIHNTHRRIVWIDGGIHAREWAAVHTALYAIDRLIADYDSDTTVRDGIDLLHFYITPVLNPDGYEYTRSEISPMIRLWRKNRAHITCKKDRWSRERCCGGVDLNRNFDWFFGQSGSSTDKCSEIYQGPTAFSEKESQAVRDTILSPDLRGKVDAFITMHTYSQMWIHPYSHQRKTVPEDITELEQIGRNAVSALENVYGTKYRFGTGADILYPAAGGSDDWAKGKGGVKYVFLLELRPGEEVWDGFILDSRQLIPTGRETWAGIKVVVEAVLKSVRRGWQTRFARSTTNRDDGEEQVEQGVELRPLTPEVESDQNVSIEREPLSALLLSTEDEVNLMEGENDNLTLNNSSQSSELIDKQSEPDALTSPTEMNSPPKVDRPDSKTATDNNSRGNTVEENEESVDVSSEFDATTTPKKANQNGLETNKPETRPKIADIANLNNFEIESIVANILRKAIKKEKSKQKNPRVGQDGPIPPVVLEPISRKVLGSPPSAVPPEVQADLRKAIEKQEETPSVQTQQTLQNTLQAISNKIEKEASPEPIPPVQTREISHTNTNGPPSAQPPPEFLIIQQERLSTETISTTQTPPTKTNQIFSVSETLPLTKAPITPSPTTLPSFLFPRLGNFVTIIGVRVTRPDLGGGVRETTVPMSVTSAGTPRPLPPVTTRPTTTTRATTTTTVTTTTTTTTLAPTTTRTTSVSRSLTVLHGRRPVSNREEIKRRLLERFGPRRNLRIHHRTHQPTRTRSESHRQTRPTSTHRVSGGTVARQRPTSRTSTNQAPCIDRSPWCGAWLRGNSNVCSVSSIYMKRDCARSCRFCH